MAIIRRRSGARQATITSCLKVSEDVLDLALRLRVHLLMESIRMEKLPVEELSPGVRSLQIRYASNRIEQSVLMRHLLRMEETLPDVAALKIPTRVVHLPIAFEDSATLGAIQRYRETVRADAPWLPSNLEFLRRINGLKTIADVLEIVHAARYMVLGLGDVYLGAPCAVPVDPRHRLLSSKYNPARTYTAEGTVGIGGMYMCIYGMDSPGGYQLVGRTLPIWNKFLKNAQFETGKPWLLRFFDQVCFYPVEEAELTEQREAFRAGRHRIRVEEEIFDYGAYRHFWNFTPAASPPSGSASRPPSQPRSPTGKTTRLPLRSNRRQSQHRRSRPFPMDTECMRLCTAACGNYWLRPEKEWRSTRPFLLLRQ